MQLKKATYPMKNNQKMSWHHENIISILYLNSEAIL